MEIEEVTKMQEKMWELYAEKKELEDKAEKLGSQLQKYRCIMLKLMEDNEVDRYDCQYGSMTYQAGINFKFPSNIEDKAKYFSWIKEKYGEDVYLDKVSIYAATNNSFLKEEYLAQEAEKENSFFVPGVSPPEPYVKLGMNKKRGSKK